MNLMSVPTSKLALDPNLAALAPQVQDYYNVLLTARDTQQQKEGWVESLSSQREEQRKLVAKALYVVLGNLMAKFVDDTAQIDNYFDLSLICQSDAIPATSIVVKGKVSFGLGVPVAGAIVGVQGKILRSSLRKPMTKAGMNSRLMMLSLKKPAMLR